MQNDRIFYLLRQYLDNSITLTELHEMRELLLQEDASTDAQSALEAILGQSPSLPDYREDEWDPLFRKVLAGRDGEMGEGSAPVRRIPFYKKKWWAAAAAVFILLAGGAGFLFYKGAGNRALARSVDSKLPSSDDIAPGSDKAILTLADGVTVNLSDAKNGVVGKQGDSRLIKQNGMVLSYQQGTGRNRRLAEVSYNLLTTPRGGQYRLILPDGSKVWLNAASSLRYPTSFTGKERVVTLQGEAYFEVAKNSAMPFRVAVAPGVREKAMEIVVLGTDFDVMAYGDEATVNTTLLEGSVQVRKQSGGSEGSGGLLIKPGEQAQLSSAGAFKVAPTDTEEAVAWKNGLFRFNEATIEEVMRQVARWYDVEVIYENEASKDLFQGEIYRNVSVSKVLKVLEASGVHFTVEGKKILVRS